MTRTLSIHALAVRVSRIAALACVAVAASGCTLDKQVAPGLAGPSEFGTSVTLVTNRDRLDMDGESQAMVTARVRNPQGEPMRAVVVRFTATASDGTPITLTGSIVSTDSAGAATIGVVAPPAPRFTPAQPVTVVVQAAPDVPATTQFVSGPLPTQLTLTLVPPPGLPPPNNAPVAIFVFAPAVPVAGQSVTFDASASTDEGALCMTACTYAWTFGDGGAGAGLAVGHTYSNPGTYTVTLTVTDVWGTTSRPVAKPVIVALPAAPTAVLKASPIGPKPGEAVNFDASESTAAPGAKITQYQFIFGDGTSQTTSTPFYTKVDGYKEGTYLTRVIVTDNFGRTVASIDLSVTVAP